MERWQTAGFGLYVHWPFCLSKCPYCDFNSHIAANIDHDAWLAAYLSEIDRIGKELPNRLLSSIFFGGGTPSLMPADTAARIIERASRYWRIANDIEITLEANPTSVEVSKFRDFHAAGINRVSIGIQALNDNDLKLLGRTHDAKMARQSIDIAHTIFERSSFDLIYARQDQSASSWQNELQEALTIIQGQTPSSPTQTPLGHISLYQLTIEEGTVFGARHQRGLLRGLPGEDASVELYQITQGLCANAGLPAYEISNHATLGNESRHNLIYWKSGDYAGIGPGAHGRLTIGKHRFATECLHNPNEWLHQVKTAQTGEVTREALDIEAQAHEFLLMGMRLTQGISLKDYHNNFRLLIPQVKQQSLIDMGLIEIITSAGVQVIKASASGRLLLNKVIEQLAL